MSRTRKSNHGTTTNDTSRFLSRPQSSGPRERVEQGDSPTASARWVGSLDRGDRVLGSRGPVA